MDNLRYIKEEISIEQAINLTSGNQKYQRTMLMVVMLSIIGLTPMLLCVPQFLPLISSNCSDDSCDDYDTLEGMHDRASIRWIFMGSSHIGTIIGFFIVSFLADIYGRKTIIKNSCIGGAFSLTVVALSSTITMLCIAMLCTGILFAGMFHTSFILCCETINSKSRNSYLAFYFIIISIFAAIFSLLYSIEGLWRYLILFSASLVLLQAFLMDYIFESPRFLLTNLVDVEGATKVMTKISLINGVGEFPYTLVSENSSRRASRDIRLLCRSRGIVLKGFVCIAVWFCVLFGYYSIMTIRPVFFENIYYDNTATNLFRIIPVPLIAYFVDAFGRKKTIFVTFTVVATIFFILAVMAIFCEGRPAVENAMRVLGVIVNSAMGGELYLIYIYTAEMFPTFIRSSGMGICNAAGKISVLVVMTMKIYEHFIGPLGFLIFGIVLLACALISVLLVETVGKKIEEVVDYNNGEPLIDRD